MVKQHKQQLYANNARQLKWIAFKIKITGSIYSNERHDAIDTRIAMYIACTRLPRNVARFQIRAAIQLTLNLRKVYAVRLATVFCAIYFCSFLKTNQE